MKKISALVFVLSLFVCCFAVNSYASSCSESAHSNRNDHEYTWYWSDVTRSYLVDCSDDTVMRFQYDDTQKKMFAEYYTYDYEFIYRVEIDSELPVFGGFYSSDDYFFVLTGQTNYNESAAVECFRITKYDKNWNRITSAGLYDCNTTVPFDAGSARFAECGNYLIIRTAHEMYTSSDGLNHQANVTIELDMYTMQITDSYTDVMNVGYGYVSHSFNQFIEVENNNIVAVDHGDAYPRSVCLIKYFSDASDGTFVPDYWSNSCVSTDMLPIYGNIGANYTGCTVGGFEISSSAYLVAGTSVVQNAEHFYDNVQNVYVSSLSKTTGQVTLTYITNYTDGSASVPYLVKLSDSSFLLMWEKGGYVYYTKLDASGNVVSATYKMNASLSDCEPVIINGNIVWYVCDKEYVDFYLIDTAVLSATEKKSVLSGHNYEFTSSQGYRVYLTCSECGNEKSGVVPSRYYIYQANIYDSYYETYSLPAQQTVHPGDVLILHGNTYHYTTVDFDDTTVKASDPSVAKVEEFYVSGIQFFKVTFLKEGNVDFVYSSVYPCEYGSEFSVTVKHSYDSGKVTKKATCAAKGVKTYTCTECSATKKTAIAKTAHSYTNSCDKTCNVCSATRNITHTYKTTTTKATFSKNGSVKTVCSVCGYVKSTKTVRYVKTVALSSTSYTFNGNVKTPSVTVKDSAGNVLKKGTDYTVSYASGRKNAGTYKVTVTMKGNYSGTKTLSFKIKPIDISTCKLKLSATSLRYNGEVRTPEVSVTNSYGTTLKAKNYTVTYSSGRKNVGTYKVTVKMKGNYTGTKTLTFKIKPIDISTCKVTLSATSLTYNGEIRTPEVSVTNSYGTKLKASTYTVTYSSGRKNVGTYKITVKMKGNYTGTKTLTFKILPPKTTVSKLTAGAKKITVNLAKKTTQVTGYQIQYSTSKDFTNAKTKTLTSYSTVKTTLTGLTANKTYYVRVRTYKTVNDVKYYSGWSAYKYVKTK